MCVLQKRKYFIFILYFITLYPEQINGTSALTTANITTSLRKKLFSTLLANQATNFIMSALALTCPLSLLALGAEDEAKYELMSALGITVESHLIKQCSYMLNLIRHNPDMMMLNEIYLEESLKLYPTFLNESFETAIQPIGFSKYPSSSIAFINRRVSEILLRHIRDVIQPHDVDKNTSMLLVNAAYFKGSFEHPFSEKSIHFEDFIKLDKKKVKVPMMHQREEFRIIESSTLDAKIVQMKLVSVGTTMTFVLPNTPSGIYRIIRRLVADPDILYNAKKTLIYKFVYIKIPIFKIKSEDYDLTNVLKKIGIKRIFNTFDSGLSKVVVNGTIPLNKVKQKISVEITQEGTTYIPMPPGLRGMPGDGGSDEHDMPNFAKDNRYEAEFIANRPFYFSIDVGIREMFQGIYFASEYN